MEFKKFVPIIIVIVSMSFVAISPVSAATSSIVLQDYNGNVLNSFSTSQDDDCLEILGYLYVDGEWKGGQKLNFDVFDSIGYNFIHYDGITKNETGYSCMTIMNYVLDWEPGDYTLRVSYGGNEDKGWPATSTTAVIKHPN